jgi:hypothetical protein
MSALINARVIAERLAEHMRLQWLQVRAAAADSEIRNAHTAGIRGTETLREYALQRDAYWAEMAQIETHRLLRKLEARATRLAR